MERAKWIKEKWVKGKESALWLPPGAGLRPAMFVSAAARGLCFHRSFRNARNSGW